MPPETEYPWSTALEMDPGRVAISDLGSVAQIEGSAMLSNPTRGQIVRIRYAPPRRQFVRNSLHGKYGRVLVPGTGRPRSHLVHVDGHNYIIPAGQLFQEPDRWR